jgi:hypothetical protein
VAVGEAAVAEAEEEEEAAETARELGQQAVKEPGAGAAVSGWGATWAWAGLSAWAAGAKATPAWVASWKDLASRE